MPLGKRLTAEMCSEWREQAICYKDLQREAEELVGNDDEEQEAVFRFHAEFAMETASEFYDKKVKELQSVFNEVALCVGGVHDMHKDREKSAVLKTTSPTTSSEHLWALPNDPDAPSRAPQDEDRIVMEQCFAIWKQDTEEKPGRTSLLNFVGPAVLLTLEESALKDALREFLQMLVYIDRIRNFALLNSVIIIKIAQRHCSSKIEKALIAALHELPMYQMTAINTLVPEMETLARKLHHKLSGGTIDELPTSWSMHVCAFCAHTAKNAVLLAGRTCCWQCAAGSATNAIVFCPLTDKPMDIKGLRLERVLVSFLRRFFPASLKDAPAPLIGTIVKVAVAAVLCEANTIGMLAALKSPNLRPKHLCKTKATTPSRRSQRATEKMRPASLAMDKLDLEVSEILKGLVSPTSNPGKGETMCTDSPNLLPLRRRERSISISGPAERPNLDTLFLGGPLMAEAARERAIEPRNMRGFPLCAAGCWCIERQAAVCLDLSQATAV
mmetsp:Transcript_73236/g.107491  ORF Transcript_73236/g.107491 Transcript_73236/m.107491 type:complete len:499 (-) Transcript_73236:264-1760(-)